MSLVQPRWSLFLKNLFPRSFSVNQNLYYKPQRQKWDHRFQYDFFNTFKCSNLSLTLIRPKPGPIFLNMPWTGKENKNRFQFNQYSQSNLCCRFENSTMVKSISWIEENVGKSTLNAFIPVKNYLALYSDWKNGCIDTSCKQSQLDLCWAMCNCNCFALLLVSQTQKVSSWSSWVSYYRCCSTCSKISWKKFNKMEQRIWASHVCAAWRSRCCHFEWLWKHTWGKTWSFYNQSTETCLKSDWHLFQALVKSKEQFSGRDTHDLVDVFEDFGYGMIFADYGPFWKSQRKFGLTTLRG